MIYNMNSICILCLQPSRRSLIKVSTIDDDGLIVEMKLKSILEEDEIKKYFNEIVLFKPDIPKHICVACMKYINGVYMFRKSCLKNFISLHNVIEEIKTGKKIIPEFEIKEEPMELENFQCTTHSEQIVNATSTIKAELEIIKEMKEDFEEPEEITPDNWEDLLAKSEFELLHEEVDIKEEQYCTDVETITSKSTKQCKLCDGVFKNIYDLRSHLHKHSKHFPHQCELCGKLFNVKKELYDHILNHNVEDAQPELSVSSTATNPEINTYRCKYCDKKFNIRSNYKSHLDKHSDVYPYQCEYCGKSFSDQNGLNNHQLFCHSDDISVVPEV